MSGGSLASQLNERLCYEVHDLKAELAQLRKRNAELERRIAAKESMEVSYTDERGVTWNRPTAYAYAKACAALDARYEALQAILQITNDDVVAKLAEGVML